MEEGSLPNGTSSEAWQIFLQLEDLPPALREYRLVEVCGEDSALQREVVRLLTEEEDQTWLFQPGDLLDDKYEVIRPIGRGGLSEVFLAIRLDDDERSTNAIKILRGGDYDGLARAEREGLRLRDLEHENIPGYRDHGILPTGQPFLAMEYIHGLPIDLYCEKNKLAIRARLQLFLRVCSAVSFLHQKRLLHRDLKPSNILVTGMGVPKVLDFNIAKRLRQEGGADQTLTAGRVMPPFTANYASPEQIIGRYLDQSSDVYSLGVVLYEMLTGAVPADLGHLLDQPEELRRAALKEEIAPPSAVAAEFVDRDLDFIAKKALRKESQDRYQSVVELSEELLRFLASEPVLARDGRWIYRLKKYFKRHRTAILVAATIWVLFITFFAMLYSQWRETVVQKELATRRADFLQQVFVPTDLETGSLEDITALNLIENASERVASSFPDDRDATLRGQIRVRLAQGFLTLGEYEKSAKLADTALVDLSSSDSTSTGGDEYIEALLIGADALRQQGDFGESQERYRQALAASEGVFGTRSIEVARVQERYALLLRAQGNLEEAKQLLDVALHICLENPGEDREQTARTYSSLASLHSDRGHYPQAEEAIRKALGIREELYGEEHSLVAESLNNLSNILSRLGEYEQMEAVSRRCLKIVDATMPPSHPHRAKVLDVLAFSLRKQGKLDEAEDLLRQALRIEEEALGSENPSVAMTITNLASTIKDQGRLDEAIVLFKRALQIRREKLGNEHYHTATTLNNLGIALSDRGDFDAAEVALQEGLDIRKATSGKTDIAVTMSNLARVYKKRGAFAKAISLYTDAQAILSTELGASHPHVATLEHNLGCAYLEAGDLEHARKLLSSGLAMRQNIFGPDHLVPAISMGQLAKLERREGNYRAEAQLLESVLDISKSKLPSDHPDIFKVAAALGRALLKVGDLAAAREILTENLQVKSKPSERGSESTEVREVLNELEELSKTTR